MSSASVAHRRGQFSTGLVATSGGMAPSGNHPGLRPSQKPTFQPASREHLPTADARQNKVTNLNDSQSAPASSAAKGRGNGEPAPTGRRHLDPHHFTNLSDDAKRQEGRLGRAHVRPPHSSSTTRIFGRPTAADIASAETAAQDARRCRNRNLSTSVQLAEGRLRRLASGKDAAGGDPAKQAAYQAAAQGVLAQYRGDTALVKQEQVLAHRIASDAYASESAQRQAAMEGSRQDGGGNGDLGALGPPAPALQSSTPFALDDSRPRKDNNLSVTGGHGLRIHRNHNRDHFPITGGPGPGASAEEVGRDSEGVRVAAEEARRRQNEKHYVQRGMKGDRPFDDEASAGERYPTPPPVGVSIGIHQKPRMVRPVPGAHQRSDDRDSLALKRARAQAPYSRNNVESSPSMDRPEYFAPRTEAAPQAGQQQQQQRQRQAPVSLRERTEARWKREEAEREARHTGRARVGRHNQHTALW